MSDSRTKRINEKLKKIQSAINIRDIRSCPPAMEILKENEDFKYLKGYVVELSVADHEIYVPDVSTFPDRNGKPYNAEENKENNAPLLTLKEWRNAYPPSNRPDLLINANWFKVVKQLWGQNVYMDLRTELRTSLAGLSISHGKLVSSHRVQDQGKVNLDSILFDEKKKEARVLFNTEIEQEVKKYKDEISFFANKNAVSGFIILKKKVLVDTPRFNNRHNDTLQRTGIGIKDKGKTIVVIVIHNHQREHGVTAEEFAKLFKSFDCEEAINLDNSGSVELHYRGNTIFGKKTRIQTQTSDIKKKNEPDTERPKPNFIGFRNIKKTNLFSNEAPDKSSKHEPVLTKRRLSCSQS